jgi:hypothetical protein
VVFVVGMEGVSDTLDTTGAELPIVTLAVSVAVDPRPSAAVARHATTSPASNPPVSVLDVAPPVEALTALPLIVHANVVVGASASGSEAVAVHVSVEARVGEAGVSAVVTVGARFESTTVAKPLAVPPSTSEAVTEHTSESPGFAAALLSVSVALVASVVAVRALVQT